MPYNRSLAVNYAAFFWNKVCHDGRVAIKTGYPAQINGVTLTPGLPFSQVGSLSTMEEDCTHFLSCCVGNGSGFATARGAMSSLPMPMALPRGGGLAITSPFSAAGVYGQTWTPALVKELKQLGAKVVGPEFSVKQYTDTAIKALQPGDVLAYASADNALKYEHICLIVAPGGKIACHTRSRFGVDYDDVYFPWVTLLKMP